MSKFNFSQSSIKILFFKLWKYIFMKICTVTTSQRLKSNNCNLGIFITNKNSFNFFCVNIGASIKDLRPDAKGYVVVEILSAEDKQKLNPPDGMEVIWVIQEQYDVPTDKLTAKIRDLPWLPGRVFPWFAGEFDGMRNMRTYFRDEKNIDKKAMYLSCYWKIGDTDEGMKRAKRKDAEAESKETLIK